MSSKLEVEIEWMLTRLDRRIDPLGLGFAKAFRDACEQTAHDVVVNVDPARTRVLQEYGRLEEFKKGVATLVADMARLGQDVLRNPSIWPHRSNGDIAVFANSVLGTAEMAPQPPKPFVDALGTLAVQHLKKLFEFYGYAVPHTLLPWPKLRTEELSEYIQEVRKLRELQQALAAQQSGSQSAEELWRKT